MFGCVMNSINLVKAQSAVPGDEPATLNAFDILFKLAPTRALARRAAVRSMQIWTAAGLIGALVCWQIVANHFALSRHTDEYVTLVLNRVASHNGVLNHALYIASETTLVTGGFLVGLVWYCWFQDNARGCCLVSARCWSWPC